MFAILRLSLALCLACINLASAQTTPQASYDSLYAKAYSVANTQPDSAIYYANLATRASKKPEEKANAYWFVGFYARKQGYYSMAIQRYQKAYNLYSEPVQKAAMLENIALCYKDIGNVDKAVELLEKAVHRYEQLQDSAKLGQSLYSLANCYKHQNQYNSANNAFKRSRQFINPNNRKVLAKIYDDFARLKENQNQYDSAIHYQRLALERFAEPNLAKKCVRLVRLAWYYMLNENNPKARQYLNAALEIKQNNLVSNIMLQATQGFLLFVERKETQALEAISRSDTLLNRLSQRSKSLIQQKFAYKLSYEINQSGYKLLKRLCFYSEQRARFAPHKKWFAQRLENDRLLYTQTRVNVALKDSLEIARATPKVHVVNKLSPWWWALMAATLAIGGLVVYMARAKKIKAETEQVQAHTDFIETIKASPIKGFDELGKAEINMLTEAEYRLKRKLKLEEIQMLIMVSRDYKYSEISVNLGIKESAARVRMQRFRERLNISHINELMP